MVTEGQPTTVGTPPENPPEVKEPTTQPSEEYKGLQRTISQKDTEIARLQEQVDAQPSPQPPPIDTGGQSQLTSVQILAQNAYLQGRDAAIKSGLDENAANAYGQAAGTQVLYQQAQQQVVDVNARLVVQQADQEARASAQKTTGAMRAFAQKQGLDPTDTSLDYGDEGDEADVRWRGFGASLSLAQEAQREAVAAAPVPPEPAPDRSAERVDTSGSDSPPTANAEALKQEALREDAAMKGGKKPWNAGRLAGLFKKAEDAGAQF